MNNVEEIKKKNQEERQRREELRADLQWEVAEKSRQWDAIHEESMRILHEALAKDGKEIAKICKDIGGITDCASESKIRVTAISG